MTLIQAVFSTLPTYCISFYLMPKKTIKEITGIQRNFLWGGGGENANSISWVAWNDVCLDRQKGGMGIKNLGEFNHALISKWIYRFLCNPNFG